MTNAHDKQRGHPPYFHSYDIQTPSTIPSTKFALTEQDVKDLFDEGEKTGSRVKWDEHASSQQTVSYYDPRPDETLWFSLRQAHTLFNEYTTRNRVEHLLQESTFSVYIEPDWSSRYINRSRMTVSGNKQLVLTRSVWYGEPIGGKPVSLVDLNVIAKEVLSGGEKDLIRIPAYNSERERGYLLFYSPPLSSESPRDFRHEFEVNQEFAKTVEKGQEDFVAYSVQRLGDNHRLKLRFEILVHVELPNLRFYSDVERDLEEERTLVSDPKTKASYKRYFVDIPETPIIGTVMFKIRFSRA